MKIAVNTRLLLPGRIDGIGRFSQEILRHLARKHPEIEFYFLFDRKYDPRFLFSANVRPVILPPQARHPLLWSIWFQQSVRRFLLKNKPDLFLSPDGFLPYNTGITSIAVIHDLNFESDENFLPSTLSNYYRKHIRESACLADAVITVSNWSAREIIRKYNIQNHLIHVVPNGLGEQFHPLDKENQQMVRNKFTAGAPFILYSGSITPRKNIPGLLEAYALFASDFPEFRLVIAGSPLHGYRNLPSLCKQLGIEKHVIFTGTVSDVDLAGLTASAELLALVSHYEGFGLPVIEAMACRTPVVCSGTTALREVAGDAAYLVRPDAPVEIASAFREIVANPELRANLIDKGLKRAGLYNWEKSAERLWDVILKTVK